MPNNSQRVLIADDDEEDRLLARRAFEASRFCDDLQFVADGQQLLAYLNGPSNGAVHGACHRPDVVLLDLQMPVKDGRDALQEIRATDHLRDLVVVVLSTSSSPRDIRESYLLGANSYITKPSSFDGWIAMFGMVKRYWLDTVTLPRHQP